MKISRRVLIVAGAGMALAAGGTGVALATGNGGGSEENDGAPVAATQAAQAKAAALKVTGGGRVTALERDNEDGATYEVEVTTPSGGSVDVRLDGRFALVGRPEANNDANDQGERQDKGDGNRETADDHGGVSDKGDGETNDDHGIAGAVDRGDGDGETADDAPATTATR